MPAGVAHITLARNGADIVLVQPSYPDARDELERVAELAPDAEKVVRSNGHLRIHFAGGGSIRVVTPRYDPRGRNFDEVLVHPDAATDELTERYAPSLATTGGAYRIDA